MAGPWNEPNLIVRLLDPKAERELFGLYSIPGLTRESITVFLCTWHLLGTKLKVEFLVVNADSSAFFKQRNKVRLRAWITSALLTVMSQGSATDSWGLFDT